MKRPPRGATTRVLHKQRGSYLCVLVHHGHRNRVTMQPGTRSCASSTSLDQPECVFIFDIPAGRVFRLLVPFFFFFYTTCSSPPRPPLVFPACFITVKHFFYLFNIFLTRFPTSFFVPLVIPFFKFFLALLFILFGQFINPLINLFFFIQFFIQFLFAYSLEFFSYLKNPRKNIFLHLYTRYRIFIPKS